LFVRQWRVTALDRDCSFFILKFVRKRPFAETWLCL